MSFGLGLEMYSRGIQRHLAACGPIRRRSGSLLRFAEFESYLTQWFVLLLDASPVELFRLPCRIQTTTLDRDYRALVVQDSSTQQYPYIPKLHHLNRQTS